MQPEIEFNFGKGSLFAGQIINITGKGDFLAVFNRNVSSDETLRAVFQKMYACEI